VSQLETQTSLAFECSLRKDFRPLRLPDLTAGDDFISMAHRLSADSTTRSTARRCFISVVIPTCLGPKRKTLFFKWEI